MNTLVISDTHLAPPFDEKKFNFLSSIIKDSDRVIINGDFWDGYLTTFREFIDSPWKNLFPQLKSKKAVYIFGNHDKETFSEKSGIQQFSTEQTQRYLMYINGIKYIFEHGHRLLPFGDDRNTVPPKNPLRLTKLADRIERFIIQNFGAIYQDFLYRNNTKLKNKLKNELKEGEYYVCGHTHCGEIDHKNRFINTGIIKHGLAQYLMIKDNSFYIKQEYYL